MDQNINADIDMSATVGAARNSNVGIQYINTYTFEAYDKHGNLKWAESVKNIMTNVGLDESITQLWKGAGYTAAYYVGLTDGAPTVAAGDTMSSHAGWVEVAAYSESNRPTLTLGTVASQSVDNSASKASFSINANGTTIGGGFIANDNTISGTSGILMSVVAFTGGNKSLDNGDTLNVTVTLTASSA